MKSKLKRILSAILIIAIVMTSTGFSTFAEGISETVKTTSETMESESGKYYKDLLEEQTIANADSISDESTTIVEEKEDNSITEEEPTTAVEEEEENESITVESEVDKKTTEDEEETIASPSEGESIDTSESGVISDEEEESNDVATDSEIDKINEIPEERSPLFEIKTSTMSETTLFGDTPLYGDIPSTIWFGVYPQNDESGVQLEPIKWRVLSQDANEALLLSDKILDNVSYHQSDISMSWANSYIRDWLNNTFKTKAFATTQHTNGIVNKDITTSGSANTQDRVFLLDRAQAQNMGNEANRMAEGTTFAKGANSVNGELEVYDNGMSIWFLRFQGDYPNYPGWVGEDGKISSFGPHVNYRKAGVRPALYANLQSAIFQSASNTVTWQLNGSTFKDGSTLWSQMNTYVGGQKLPDTNNMTERPGLKFFGWGINNGTRIYTSIPENQTGNIILSPIWSTTLRKNWYNSRYDKSYITNINFVNAAEPSSGYDERWIMNTTDNIYAYRTGNVVNIYGNTFSGLGSWESIFAGFTNLESIDFTNVNMSEVTSMESMFENCTSLNNITFGSNFNTATVSNMSNMFMNCTSLTRLTLPANFYAGHVTNMSRMFSGCSGLTTLTLPDSFNTSAVTDMTSMFDGCTSLNSITFGSNFNTANVTNMSNMFMNCTSFTSLTLPANFYAGYVTNMSRMFSGCSGLTTLTLPDSFNTSSVTDMSNMFNSCSSVTNITGTNFLINNATNVSGMFSGCSALQTFDFKGSTFENVQSTTDMFSGCTALTELKINTDFRGLPAGTTSTDMFEGCTNLKGGAGTKTSHTGVGTDGTYARVDYGGILPGYFTCSDNTIYNNVNIQVDRTWSDNITKANIKKIKFTHDATMETVDSSIDIPTTIGGTATANSKGYLKDSNEALVIHFASAIPKLKTVADWTNFFADFTNLESIEGLELIDTSVVRDMTGVFKDCAQLQTVALGDIDIKNVTTVESVFENCTSLTQLTGNIASFSSLVSAKNAFKGCTSIPVFSFDICDTPTLTDVSGMFDGCSALTTIYVDDNYQGLPAGVNSTNMFKDCTLLVGGEGFSYNTAAPITDGSVANVDYGGIKPGYFTILDTSKYANATFNLPTNWYDLHAAASKPKSDITTIKFYNDATGVGSYDSNYYMSDIDHTRFYIDGNIVKIHYGHSIPALKVSGDFSGFFKDFTNLTAIEGLEDKIDLTEVTNMSELFSGCSSLTNVSFNPNTQNVTDMSKIFFNCASLSEVHIGPNLKLDKVENLESAFENCRNLSVFDIGVASFSNIRNLSKTFKNCEGLTSFKFDICALDHLTALDEAFSGCVNLTTIYVNDNFPGLPTTGLTSDHMFENCTSLVGGQGFTYNNGVSVIDDGRVARVDYGGIKPGYYTIYGTPEQVRNKYENAHFNLPATWFDEAVAGGVNKDDVVKIKFYNDAATGTDMGIGHYDGYYQMSVEEGTAGYYENELDANGNPTGKIIAKIHFGNLLPGLKVGADFSGFFKDFKNIKTVEGLELLNLSDVEDMSELFSGCESLESISLTPNISNVKDMDKIFYNCKNLTSVNLGVNVNLGNVETFESAFENCEKLTAEGINIHSTVPLSHIKTFKNAFKNCKALTAFQMNVGNADTLIDLEGMFNGCESLISVNASSINLTNVESVKEMFSGCKNLRTLVSGNYSNLATVSNLEKMFYNCESLTAIPPIHITSDKITTMKAMFASCSNITQVGIVSAKTDNLVSDGLVDLFLNCKKLTTVVFGQGFVLGNATDLSNMFSGCENLTYLDLSNFSSNNIINVTDMFKNNRKLTAIIASNSFAVKGKTGDNMFLNCDMLAGGEGTSYKEANVNDSTYACVDEGPTTANPGYFTWGDVTLTFLPGDGGTGSMSSRKVTRGVATNVGCSFKKSGSKFTNWVDERGTIYGTTITPIRSMVLTAVWQQIGSDEYVPTRGGGGGTVGGGRGGLINDVDRSINFVMQTLIYENEYTWTYDENGERNGILLNMNSTVAKAMINADETKGCYILRPETNSILIGGGGIYKVQYHGSEFWFGFGKDTKLTTGFVETSTQTRMLTVAAGGITGLVNTEGTKLNKTFIEKPGQVAKYYLYEQNGLFKGILWNKPITIRGISYSFDITGKVISSSDTPITQGIWEYNPNENKWKYFVPNNEGRVTYYTDVLIDLYYNGETNKYIFDSQGNMVTGYTTFRGKKYYAAETGNYKGAVTEIS